MHVRNEYSQNAELKNKVREYSSIGRGGKSGLDTGGSTESAAIDSDDETDTDHIEAETDTETDTEIPSGELRGLAQDFANAQRADHDTLQNEPAHYYSRARSSKQRTSIKLTDLFDFSSSEWVERLQAVASRSLDKELEVYELLEFDAPGEEGSEDEIVDETVAEILSSL